MMSNVFVTQNVPTSALFRSVSLEVFVFLFFIQGSVFWFFRRDGDEVILFLIFSTEGRCWFFSVVIFLVISLRCFRFNWVHAHPSPCSVIHRIETITLQNRLSWQSLRLAMLYIDPNSAGQISGRINIKIPRLSQIQDGQEHSANGTGSEKTCAKGGAASNGIAAGCQIIIRHAPSERRYCHAPKSPACLPCSARALVGTAGSTRGYRRSTRQSGGLN